MKKIDAGYIGFSQTMISELLCSPFFQLKECILEKSRCTDQIRTVCESNHISLYEVKNKRELSEVLTEKSGESVFVMYENGIIIERAALLKTRVYNFHSGSFLNNRGAHPIVWSILNEDAFTEMTLHEIDAEIDQGVKIDTRVVRIDDDDDADTLKAKLEKQIPDLLLSLYQHISRREYFEREFNRYNRRVEQSDYTINLDEDSAEKIVRKVRSQSSYNGAILFVNGEKTFVRKIQKVRQTGQVLTNKEGKRCIELRQILEISDL